MTRILLLTSLVLLLTGCTTTGSRSIYGPMTDRGGYSDNQVGTNLYVSRFAGNGHTHPRDAQLFSAVRAVEVCLDKGYKFARIDNQFDLSTSRTIQRTSNFSHQQPTYFSGNTNSNSNYTHFGGGSGQVNRNTNLYATVSGGNTYAGSRSWEETITYPTIDSVFICTNQPFSVGVNLKSISADDMKPFVKDLMGAVQVQNLSENSPNVDVVQPGDMITRVNVSRVQDTAQFIAAIDSAKDKDKISITAIRDGKQITLKVKAYDVTPIAEEVANKILLDACGIPEIQKRPICSGRVPASK